MPPDYFEVATEPAEERRAISDTRSQHFFVPASRFAFLWLRWGLSVLAAALGLDKYFRFAAGWDRFAWLAEKGASVPLLLAGVGLFEILCAFVALIRPRFGGALLALWYATLSFHAVWRHQQYLEGALWAGLSFGFVALSALAVEFMRFRSA